MFDGIGNAITVMMIMLVITIPLGIWELIDIIIWLYKHIHINLN